MVKALRLVAIGVSGTGVLVLVVLAWVRLLARPGPTTPGAVVAVVVGTLVLVVALALVAVRRRARRRTAVASARPGWVLWEVWTTSGFSGALVADGLWERRLSPFGGTPMTLAVSRAGLELWRGGRRAHCVASWPWSSVAAVLPGSGEVAGRTRPAVVLHTMGGAQVVLAPAARASSATTVTRPEQTAPLLTFLRATRDAGER